MPAPSPPSIAPEPGEASGPWLLLVAASAFAYYASYRMLFPFGFTDEGYLFYVAWMINSGSRLYSDVAAISYLPGLFHSFAWAIGWAEEPIATGRWIMAGGLAVRAVLFYAVATRLVSRPWALGSTLMIAAVPGPWHKFYIGLCGLWILYTALAYLARPHWLRALHLGLAVGLTLTLRFDLGVVGLALIAWVGAMAALGAGLDPAQGAGSPETVDLPRMLRRTAGHAGITTLALTASHLPVLWALHRAGGIEPYRRQWLGLVDLVSRRLDRSVRLPPPRFEDLWALSRTSAEAWVYFGAVGAVLLFVAFQTRQSLSRLPYLPWQVTPRLVSRSEASRPSWLSWGVGPTLVLWTLGGFPQFAVERPGPGHLTQFAPFVFLPAVVLAARCLHPGAGRIQRSAVALASIALALLYVGKHGRLGQGGTAGLFQQQAHPVTLANGVTYPASSGEPLRRMLDTVIAESAPGDSIAALPFLPGVAYLTRRPLVDRHPYVTPFSFKSQEQEAAYAHKLLSEPARFVVYQPGFTFSRGEDGTLAAYAPIIDRTLEGRFEPRAESNRFYLLLEPPRSQVTPRPR